MPLHEHLVLETDDGWRVGFVDPRRFGSVDLVPTAAEDATGCWPGWGRSRWSEAFTAAVLAAALAGRRTPIKAALLGPARGRGARQHLCLRGAVPRRHQPAPAGPHGARRARRRLVPAIKATLHEAIAAGGSSLRDYVQPDGELGYFQHAWKVYGREGEPCERCPGPPACSGHPPDRAVRPQHVLLPADAAVARVARWHDGGIRCRYR